MTIEIRPFAGDPDELAAFVTGHWRKLYATDGYAPTVTGMFFRWMMPTFAGGDPRSIIAAYEGAELVGVMPSEPLDLTLFGDRVKAHWTEYSTVDSDRVGGGIGSMLREGLAERSREIGARFKISFINSGSMTGRGRRFWTGPAGRSRVMQQPRPWVRLLNGGNVASAAHDGLTRLAAYAGGLLGGQMREPASTGPTRPYRTTDLPACHAVFCEHMRSFELAFDWDEPRLGRHIGFSDLLPTYVVEDAGAVTGFATCYVFEVSGRVPMSNAVIDMIIPEGRPLREKTSLLSAAILSVQARGADLVIVLGPPVNSAAALALMRFVPLQPTYDLLLYAFEPEPRLSALKHAYTVFR